MTLSHKHSEPKEKRGANERTRTADLTIASELFKANSCGSIRSSRFLSRGSVRAVPLTVELDQGDQ